MTFTALRQAQDERAAAVATVTPLLEKLGRGERLSVEDRTSFDAGDADIARLDAELVTLERARVLAEASLPSTRETPEVNADEARAKALTAFYRTGNLAPELREYVSTDATEFRAASEGTNSAGGYLVPPGFWQRLQVALKAFGGTSNYFEQMETESGQPLQWATTNPTAILGTLLSENTQVGTQDYTFGQGTLGAYMFTSNAQLVSYQLANDSAFDIDKFVVARVGEALGRVKAQYAISGTGSSQPLGIITALGATSSAGTSGGSIAGTGGYVTLAAAAAVKNFAGSTTELIANTINPTTALSMIAAVDPAYRALGAAFHMNDNQILGLRAQVDSNGRPLLNMIDGLTEGAVGTLFGYPVVTDQNIPNLTLSTAGGPIFGHLPSAMVCRTVAQSGLLRLQERYADYLQVGFIGYGRWDHRSNDLRAAVTVKPAAT